MARQGAPEARLLGPALGSLRRQTCRQREEQGQGLRQRVRRILQTPRGAAQVASRATMARDREVLAGPGRALAFGLLCWGSHGRPGLARYGLIHALAAEQRLDSCEEWGQEPVQEGTQAAQEGSAGWSTNRRQGQEAGGGQRGSPGACGRSAVGDERRVPRGLPDFMGLIRSGRKCHLR